MRVSHVLRASTNRTATSLAPITAKALFNVFGSCEKRLARRNTERASRRQAPSEIILEGRCAHVLCACIFIRIAIFSLPKGITAIILLPNRHGITQWEVDTDKK